jgi:hypothetical protein
MLEPRNSASTTENEASEMISDPNNDMLLPAQLFARSDRTEPTRTVADALKSCAWRQLWRRDRLEPNVTDAHMEACAMRASLRIESDDPSVMNSKTDAA